jgi:hypothetical protein
MSVKHSTASLSRPRTASGASAKRQSVRKAPPTARSRASAVAGQRIDQVARELRHVDELRDIFDELDGKTSLRMQELKSRAEKSDKEWADVTARQMRFERLKKEADERVEVLDLMLSILEPETLEDVLPLAVSASTNFDLLTSSEWGEKERDEQEQRIQRLLDAIILGLTRHLGKEASWFAEERLNANAHQPWLDEVTAALKDAHAAGLLISGSASVKGGERSP